MLQICAQVLMQILVGILAWSICSMRHSVCASMMRAIENASVTHAMAECPSSALVACPRHVPKMPLLLYWRTHLWILWQACHPRICRHAASMMNTYIPGLAGRQSQSALPTHGQGEGGS